LSKLPLHSDSLQSLKGVGPKVLERLNKLGLRCIQDILFHLPYRYEDRTQVVFIGSLRQGVCALVEGVVDHAQVAYSRKGKSRRMLLVHLSDGTGSILLRFFYFNKQQQQALVTGARLRCFGDVRLGGGSLEIVHPEYTQIKQHENLALKDALTPVYHTIDGVSQVLLRRLSQQCLAREHQYYSLKDALHYVHRPPPEADLKQMFEGRHASQVRLIFEELLAQHLSLQALRNKNRQKTAEKLNSNNHLIFQFLKSLPFE